MARQRDYRAEYARRQERARAASEALGLPPPSARAAAGHRAGGPASVVSTLAGRIWSPPSVGRAGTLIGNLRGDTHVQVEVQVRMPDGTTRRVELFQRGGIRARSLRAMAGFDPIVNALHEQLAAQYGIEGGEVEAVEVIET